MIVCWRTDRVPAEESSHFLDWIEENRALRQAHGILFEIVLQRSSRQNPTKAMQAAAAAPDSDEALVVVTAWASHDDFDAWVETPDRDRLTASNVHASVTYGPITRYDTAGGYVNLDGLAAVIDASKGEL